MEARGTEYKLIVFYALVKTEKKNSLKRQASSDFKDTDAEL